MQPPPLRIVEDHRALTFDVVVRVGGRRRDAFTAGPHAHAKLRRRQADDQPGVRHIVHRRSEIHLDEAVDVDHERQHAVEFVGRRRVFRARRRYATPGSRSRARDGTLFAQPWIMRTCDALARFDAHCQISASRWPSSPLPSSSPVGVQ